MNATTIGIIAHILIEVLLVIRVMTRPHRDPASRIAWIAVIAALPFLGMLIYLLLGETNIGRRRTQRMKQVIQRMPAVAAVSPGDADNAQAVVPERYQHLFQIGQSINGFEVIGGNSAKLMADSNATIESMVSDIDTATDHVHLLFYIWLPDNSGLKMVDALKRAAARGVKCRAMADDLGSRTTQTTLQWINSRPPKISVHR